LLRFLSRCGSDLAAKAASDAGRCCRSNQGANYQVAPERGSDIVEFQCKWRGDEPSSRQEPDRHCQIRVARQRGQRQQHRYHHTDESLPRRNTGSIGKIRPCRQRQAYCRREYQQVYRAVLPILGIVKLATPSPLSNRVEVPEHAVDVGARPGHEHLQLITIRLGIASFAFGSFSASTPSSS
jgi:hypothetical protein